MGRTRQKGVQKWPKMGFFGGPKNRFFAFLHGFHAKTRFLGLDPQNDTFWGPFWTSPPVWPISVILAILSKESRYKYSNMGFCQYGKNPEKGVQKGGLGGGPENELIRGFGAKTGQTCGFWWKRSKSGKNPVFGPLFDRKKRFWTIPFLSILECLFRGYKIPFWSFWTVGLWSKSKSGQKWGPKWPKISIFGQFSVRPVLYRFYTFGGIIIYAFSVLWIWQLSKCFHILNKTLKNWKKCGKKSDFSQKSDFFRVFPVFSVFYILGHHNLCVLGTMNYAFLLFWGKHEKTRKNTFFARFFHFFSLFFRSFLSKKGQNGHFGNKCAFPVFCPRRVDINTLIPMDYGFLLFWENTKKHEKTRKKHEKTRFFHFFFGHFWLDL